MGIHHRQYPQRRDVDDGIEGVAYKQSTAEQQERDQQARINLWRTVIREAMEKAAIVEDTEAAVEQVLRDIQVSGKPIAADVSNVLPYVKNLPIKQGIQDALMQAWSQSDYLECSAYNGEILQEAIDGGYQEIASYQLLSGILNRLAKLNNWQLKEQPAEELRSANRRQYLIDIISSGRATYPFWNSAHGQVRWLDVVGLEAESEEMLEALAIKTPELRAMLAGKAAPKPVAPAADEGITSTVKARSIQHPQAQDEFLAHPDHPEREYTKQEIARMSRAEYNNLIYIQGQPRGIARTTAINRILRNEPYAG